MGVVVCRMCCPTHAVSEVSAVWPCVFCVLIWDGLPASGLSEYMGPAMFNACGVSLMACVL